MGEEPGWAYKSSATVLGGDGHICHLAVAQKHAAPDTKNGRKFAKSEEALVDMSRP